MLQLAQPKSHEFGVAETTRYVMINHLLHSPYFVLLQLPVNC